MVVYDVSNLDTFGNVRRWLQEIEQNCDDVVRILGKSCTLACYCCLHMFSDVRVNSGAPVHHNILTCNDKVMLIRNLNILSSGLAVLKLYYKS